MLQEIFNDHDLVVKIGYQILVALLLLYTLSKNNGNTKMEKSLSFVWKNNIIMITLIIPSIWKQQLEQNLVSIVPWRSTDNLTVLSQKY